MLKASEPNGEAQNNKLGHFSKFNKFTCKICKDQSFDVEEKYLYHITMYHKGRFVENYMCNDCGKQYRWKSDLTTHINSKCGTIKLYQCQMCNQKLMSAGSLHNHILRHKGDLSYMCRFCAKLFHTAGELKVHERIHTQDKVYICKVCGKGFCHRQSLVTHSSLHTGIKPYMCENCGNSFSCIGNLLKHRKTHSETCGLVPLTTHRVKHPSTKIKVKVNTPLNSKLKAVQKEKELQENLARYKIELANKTSTDNIHNENYKPDAHISVHNNFISVRLEEKMIKQELPNETDKVIEDVQNEISKDSNKLMDTECSNNFEPPLDLSNNTENYTDTRDSENNEDKNGEDKIVINKKAKKRRKVTIHELDKFLLERDIKNKLNMKCKYCQKIYKNPRWLLQHEREHEEIKTEYERNTKCSCCKESFSTKGECRDHLQNSHSDILTCQECDKFFSNVDSLKCHERIFHKGAKRKVYTYVCEKCGEQFKQKSTLNAHKDNKCTVGPLFECKICRKKLSNAYVLKSHMRIHNPEKKLLCKFCGKSFHWKGQLVIHERSHTGEKPFTCLYCPKSFVHRESLITHSSLHTGIKPHFCKGCGSRFSCVGNLIKHRATHSKTCGEWYSKMQCNEK